MLSIYSYNAYKPFILDYLKSRPDFKRKRIAEIIGVQTAFVSQVLNGHLQLSLEQAERLSRGMGLTSQQKRYFLALVQLDRAGTTELADFFQQQVSQLKQNFENVAERMVAAEELTLDQQAKYYSSWHYQAIHYLTTIPNFQSAEKIAKRLSLDQDTVMEALEFLSDCRILEEVNGKYKTLKMRTHLPKASPLNKQNHFNYRNKAMLSLTKEESSDLHYTSVFTASEADIKKIREILLSNIERINEVIAPSMEEEIFNLCFDYYRLR